jgi:DNA-binding MarR family transcriptional regulator
MPQISRQQVSRAIARLMPNIIRGVQLDFFLTKGVTQTQFLVLMAIHAERRCAMGQLARTLHVRMPTATGIIDRLVRMGHVRRFPHPEDRRHVLIALTAKGQVFIRQFQDVIRHRWEEVLRSLSPMELAMFHQVITKLQQHL